MGAKAGAGGQATEMVWWTSSATQQFGGPLSDWLSPAAVSKLVAAKTAQAEQAPPAEAKPKCPKGFKGIAARAAGLC